MDKRLVDYQAGQAGLQGTLYHHPRIQSKRPGIILAHAWRGMDDYIHDKARRIAELGYIAFVADIYGEKEPAQDDAEALRRMLPFFLDRALLQQRIGAAYEALLHQPEVESSQIAAVGFCFGGLTVIELLRSGCPIRGAVSFHGVLGANLGEQKAKTTPIAADIQGSILLLHGHDDPLVSQGDIDHFTQEMTEHKVDWQLHIYGHTAHAFTNQAACAPGAGLMYQEKSDVRAWKTMENFLTEAFVK